MDFILRNLFFSYLCERVIPGNRITVTGVFTIKRAQQVNSTERVSLFVIFQCLWWVVDNLDLHWNDLEISDRNDPPIISNFHNFHFELIIVTLSIQRGNRDKTNAGVKQPYVRVLGLDVEGDGSGGVGRAGIGDFTETEEEEFRRLASQPDIYNVIAKSIAPSIFGSVDIKKAIACLLFGGSRKRYDSLCYSNINLLLFKNARKIF